MQGDYLNPHDYLNPLKDFLLKDILLVLQEKTMTDMTEKKEKSALPRGVFFSSFGFKCIVVFILVLIFQIPMAFIRSLINDRTFYHRNAERSILEPKGGQPELQGVLIAIPYEKGMTVQTASGLQHEASIHYLFVTPETFSAQTDIEPEMLRRGIFEVPVFNCDVNASGMFSPIEENSVIENRASAEDHVKFEDALLLVGISNKKIVTSLPEIKVDGEILRQSLFEPNTQSPFSNTIYYDLGARAKNGFKFEMSAKIQGGKTFSLTPHAAQNKFVVHSNWSAPGFSGGWLPTEREIGENGFSAEWNIPGLSTNFPKRWSSESANVLKLTEYGDYKVVDARNTVEQGSAQSVRVSFYQSVDNYQKAMRSAKYSILFLLVPFIALLVFEIFSKVKIHSIQYGLIGLANVVFYLLLLSISEHISFDATYWIASVAVSSLMLFYGAAIFHKLTYGVSFAVVNLISYIFLFGTLQAEDYALLLGSVGIFAVVAALMILTHKIDWYKMEA